MFVERERRNRKAKQSQGAKERCRKKNGIGEEKKEKCFTYAKRKDERKEITGREKECVYMYANEKEEEEEKRHMKQGEREKADAGATRGSNKITRGHYAARKSNRKSHQKERIPTRPSSTHPALAPLLSISMRMWGVLTSTSLCRHYFFLSLISLLEAEI
jgi:hypothetical protein